MSSVSCGPVGQRRGQPQGGLSSGGTLLRGFHLDRYGHLYDQAADTMDKLDALLGDPGPAVSNVAQMSPKRGPRAGG